MKTLLQKSLSILFFVVLALSARAQTIRIADNTANKPTGTNIYATLQAAIDAAVNGDIVYVQPSTSSYGDATINKSITLRGIGFNTLKDIALNSTVGNLALSISVDGSTNASGTTIEGIAGNDIYLGNPTGSFGFTLKNVTISNCILSHVARFGGYQDANNITIKNSQTQINFSWTNVTSLLIYGNYLYGQIGFGGCNSGGSLSGAIFSNNIINQSTQTFFSGIAISSLLITNNVFVGGTDIGGSRLATNPCGFNNTLTDAIVSNNIFFGYSPFISGPGAERNAFYNNLSFGTSNDAMPPTGTGVGNTGSNNIPSADPKFVAAPFNTPYAYTFNFQLQSGSPAKNAGSDGTDIGITGGAYASTTGVFGLKPSSTPVIMTLNPSGIVPQGQPIKTSIKAKSY